jgi:hypothetical protein
MGEIDARTIDGLTATLVRALEQGDAAQAASLYEPGARLLAPAAPVITGTWPSSGGSPTGRGGTRPTCGTPMRVDRS